MRLFVEFAWPAPLPDGGESAGSGDLEWKDQSDCFIYRDSVNVSIRDAI